MKNFLILALTAVLASAEGARLKDFASIEGVRDNQLIGYGIVVGLAGTGDKQLTLFSTQTLSNLLQRMGVTVNPAVMQVHNMASVMVTATLPPFAQPVRVSTPPRPPLAMRRICKAVFCCSRRSKPPTVKPTPWRKGPSLLEASSQAAAVIWKSKIIPPSAALLTEPSSNARRPRCSRPRT
jgi:hypothetical protein